MSLLSDLNNKIKALSARVGTEVKSLWEGVNTAQSTATAAQTTANTAQSTATAAQSTANTAKSTADTANSTANSAKTTANTAQSTANTANSTANTALNTANAKVSKSGDTMSGPLKNTYGTSTWVNGFKGNALVSSELGAGGYVALLRGVTNSGYMTLSSYQDGFWVVYQDKSVVDSNTNSTKYSVKLLDENGNTTIASRLVFANGTQFWIA